MKRILIKAFLLLSPLLAISSSFAQDCVQTIEVTGYRFTPDLVIVDFGNLYAVSPVSGSGPGSAYSASPNAHTNCSATAMNNALRAGSGSTPSQPTNTALPIPLRYANPIDISNGSPIAAQYGGVSGAGGFVIFPNWAKGVSASLASMGNYAQQGYTISQLINTWAPPGSNPNTMTNFLASLGTSQAIADATMLSSLTSEQLVQVLAAFSWQEGFKPSGC